MKIHQPLPILDTDRCRFGIFRLPFCNANLAEHLQHGFANAGIHPLWIVVIIFRFMMTPAREAIEVGRDSVIGAALWRSSPYLLAYDKLGDGCSFLQSQY